jgi:hypothetical protein
MRTASVGTYFKKDESGEKASEIRPSGPEWRSLRKGHKSGIPSTYIEVGHKNFPRVSGGPPAEGRHDHFPSSGGLVSPAALLNLQTRTEDPFPDDVAKRSPCSKYGEIGSGPFNPAIVPRNPLHRDESPAGSLRRDFLSADVGAPPRKTGLFERPIGRSLQLGGRRASHFFVLTLPRRRTSFRNREQQ